MHSLIVLYYQISVDIFLLVKRDDDYSQTVNYRIDFSWHFASSQMCANVL